MPGPTLAQYLDIREKELESQRSVVLGHLKPIDDELAQVKKMKALIASAREAGLTDLASEALLAAPPQPPSGPIEAVQTAALKALSEADLTIKEMILRALRDHFHNTGASPSELRDYMKSAYEKDIDRNSISPQLARLREESMVDQLSDGKWKLSKNGIGIMRYGRPRLHEIR